jgi:hypothetical protein
VGLTGAGWASGEAVHIHVDDSAGNTWSFDSNPDPVADTSGSFTYSFSLPSTLIANYTATATGATSGTATTTFTDNTCPSSPTASNVDQNPDNTVEASFASSGSTATYTLATRNLSASGGIPGVIDYCVYPSSQPDSVAASYDSWTAESGNPFSFSRPNGDPTNVPLDGNTYTIGTATWSGSVPTGQKFVLHVNDPAFCQAYNGSGTCFVTPGVVAQDLTVSKTATPSFTRTYTWGITKSVDQTEIDTSGSATFNYTVSVTRDNGTDSDWQVGGTITVSNPNDWEAITANVGDAIDNGGSCTVTGGTNMSVPKSGHVDLPYDCNFSSNPGSGTNTATATWSATTYSTPDGSATGTAGYTFGAPTMRVNQTIIVTDTFNNGTPTMLGTLTATDSTPFASRTFTYSHTVNVPTFNCVKYPNTATIIQTGLTASQTVEVCGPAQTGALTMGFWQNKNGQGIITGQAKTGPCPSAAWLTQYAPFQDLSPTATCAQVASYVSSVISAATCGSSTCNAMLKAQMLATALDVYFSDPALGGNKINAPAPIGKVTIDLTKICKMTDGSGGTGTCSGSFENVSGAFGGATSLTVSQMLSYAASQSNSGGTTWYAQVKATQVLAKDAFDAINNQVAFAP